jgi:hypothetical protein
MYYTDSTFHTLQKRGYMSETINREAPSPSLGFPCMRKESADLFFKNHLSKSWELQKFDIQYSFSTKRVTPHQKKISEKKQETSILQQVT